MTTEKKEHIPQVYDTGLAYLDPMSCGSMIAYHINGRKTYFDATITLTDCSRKIDWEFDNSMQSVEKIDNAIAILMQFRKSLVKARKDYPVQKDDE